MPTKKVTRRWLYNSFLVILIFLSLLIIAFSIAVRSYYYNSVLTIVRNTAKLVLSFMARPRRVLLCGMARSTHSPG